MDWGYSLPKLKWHPDGNGVFVPDSKLERFIWFKWENSDDDDYLRVRDTLQVKLPGMGLRLA